jgi:hypothetical protein
MKRKGPYIVHINPHARPRDPVDLWTPLVDHYLTGIALACAIADATISMWSRLWTTSKPR